MLSRLILASVILLGASAPAVAQDRMAPNAQLFSATNFMGRSLTITRETPILQASWQPRSIRMGGGSSWEVCEQRHFMGRCTVLTGSSTNLTSQLGITRIGSIRPARSIPPNPGPGLGPLPGPGGGGQSLRGMAESQMLGIIIGTLSSIFVACPLLTMAFLKVTKQDLMPKAKDVEALARRP